MESAVLFQSNWGYNSPGTQARVASQLLAVAYSLAQEIDNFNIYCAKAAAKRELVRIDSPEALNEIKAHISNVIVPDEELGDSAFIWFARIKLSRLSWLQFRVERPYLSVVAEDCESLFISEEDTNAEKNATQIIELAERIAAIDEVREILGRFEQETTFFVGEPSLLYRPKFLAQFSKRSPLPRTRDAFWKMYPVVKDSFPHDEIDDLLKLYHVSRRELPLERLSLRFCRALDDVTVDVQELFENIAEFVERRLTQEAIDMPWLSEPMD